MALRTMPMSKQLSRELTKLNIRTVEALLSSNPQHLANRSNINREELKDLIGTVSKIYAAVPQRASDMFMDYLNRPNTTLTLTTGCSTLDELLGGGLALGQWMEVYGRAAAGKTQLCLCAALHAARAGYGVAFVDTTSSFSINRLKELYQTSMNKPKRMDEEEEEEEENELQELVRVMSNIVCFKAIDVFTLLKVLDQLPSDANHQQLTILEDTSSDRTQSASSFDAFPTSFSTTSSSSSSSSSASSSSSSSSSPTLNTISGATSSNNLRLIIIDSLAAVLSPLLGTQPFGNSMMQSITLKLRAVAQHYNLTVLTTNYTVSGSEQEVRAIKPALGERWRYAPHSQLFLEASFSSLDERVATLTKSPTLVFSSFLRLFLFLLLLLSETHSSTTRSVKEVVHSE